MNKGFTLIELLAVVTLIALLSILVIPNITENINNKKGEISEVNKKILESATDIYIEKNATNYTYTYEANGSTYCIPIQSLIDANVLETPLKDQQGKEIDYSKIMKATYSYVYNGFEYEIVENSECTEVINYVSKPEVQDNMIPVTYDETKNAWVKADINSKWYNYSEQKWANAILVKENRTEDVYNSKGRYEYLNAPVGTTIIEDDILGYFVWIPRYRYQLFSSTEPIEINIVFENISTPKSSGKQTGEWLTHPAFTFGNKELSGIWVGKFETSHSSLSTSTTEDNLECVNESCSSADGITILPNVEPLRYNSVSNFFYAARSMSRSGNSFGIDSSQIDTHMMKNSEWGAVAYLSQSKYGKYGNTTYTGINKEIYQNKSLITGNSNGTPSQDETNTQCSYDDITDRGSGTGSCGGGASTTGNIYGIYDLSGASNEYVMGYLTTASETWGSTSSDDYAQFSSEPFIRYFDAYTSTTSSQACNGISCYGHALDEVNSWYEDSVNFISEESPWILRGGAYDRGTISGMFYYSRTNGKNSSSRSFRVVISRP